MNDIAKELVDLHIKCFGEKKTSYSISSDELNIVIRHGDITTTNEYGDTYTTRDLYTFFSYRCEEYEYRRIKHLLYKGTYTVEEAKHYFKHPHFNLRTVEEGSNPCYGSAYLGSLDKNLTTEKAGQYAFLELFLLEYKKFLNVESLEGGPHKRTSDLTISIKNEIVGGVSWRRDVIPNMSINQSKKFILDITRSPAFSLSFLRGAPYINLDIKSYELSCLIIKSVPNKLLNLIKVDKLGEPLIDKSKLLLKYYYPYKSKKEKLPFLFKGKEIPITYIRPEIDYLKGEKRVSKADLASLRGFLSECYNKFSKEENKITYD